MSWKKLLGLGVNAVSVNTFVFAIAGTAFVLLESAVLGAELPKYYAHPAVLDEYGVIAPWYHGINGQCDYRVRIAAETLKRYPWTITSNAVEAYPHYVFSGFWQIDTNGVITPKNPGDWGNGDLGQRATSVLNGMVDYYAYTGDPAAIAQVTYMADFIINHCVTPPDNAWPGLFISVPVKGHAYGNANPHGMIQLDLCASTGRGLLRVYQLTGNPRYLEAAKRWGDLIASRCNLTPGAEPWPRYTNPEDVKWGMWPNGNQQTGGVTMVLAFLDELIRVGHDDNTNALINARGAGRRYLADTLLPEWHLDPTWGHYFWDWNNPVQESFTTPDAARYLTDHPREFANWRNDSRNVLTLFFNRAGASPQSNGDVYSGAWAYPESSSCCGRSLWYSPLTLAPALAELAVQSGETLIRELVCRQVILQTYDIHENGVAEDGIDGGVIVNGSWFNIAHPLAFRDLLETMGWLPEELGPSRENHIMRSTAVVNLVRYSPGMIEYSTFDAPPETTDVLRLAFTPESITANGEKLKKQHHLRNNGYTVKALPNGDSIVTVRHDGRTRVRLVGKDPQKVLKGRSLSFDGEWATQTDASGRALRISQSKGATMTARFSGNQVRVIGSADIDGGLADVYLDDEKQFAPIDCWNPVMRSQQVLYYRNGLNTGPHVLRVVSRREHNPHSSGDGVAIDAVQFSSAGKPYNFPSGKGPVETQRMIFGYVGREDYHDSLGHSWRPATEFVSRLGNGKDTVSEWWTRACTNAIRGTADPELYRYGVHSPDFWVNVTVGPGKYHVRLKFTGRTGKAATNTFEVSINGRAIVESFDVASAAEGPYRAVDLLCNGIVPLHGIIQIRLKSPENFSSSKTNGEAFLQAVEVGPGKGAGDSTSKTILF